MAFLIRGLSLPAHEFLRGILFIYGLQLHQLTPNSILHIAVLITLCESSLGIHPHWSLWKHLFHLRRTTSKDSKNDVGSVCIAVRPEAEYFDLDFPDSVQGWKEKWLCVKDQKVGDQLYELPPFESTKKVIKLKSWDLDPSKEEMQTTQHLVEQICRLHSTTGKELSGVQIMTHFLRIRHQPLQARSRPMWMYTGSKDVDRVSADIPLEYFNKLVRHFTKLTKADEVPTKCRVRPYGLSKHLPAVSLRRIVKFQRSLLVGF